MITWTASKDNTIVIEEIGTNGQETLISDTLCAFEREQLKLYHISFSDRC